MKLWDKGTKVNDLIERFTVGRDPEMDILLAKFDVLGSLAHIRMLESVGLLQADELPELTAGLQTIYAEIEAGKFIIEKDNASIGMLQRMFKIGFNRAARIMDQLAEAGVVGEEEGTKPRKVLMTMEEFDQII